MLTSFCFFFFKVTATTEIYTLSLHDALPICDVGGRPRNVHSYKSKEIDELARLSDTTTTKVEEIIQSQYKTFEIDWSRARSIVLDSNKRLNENEIKEEFGRDRKSTRLNSSH